IENLINNSRKYAKTKIDIKLTKDDNLINIHFTDYGKGIPDNDMPFIFDKFYRGKNVESEQGSGLGLYIVKYLVEKMNGSVLLHNHANSFEAIVTLPEK
ncbi:MAG: sensor histidine kinase, partial [Acutalibacteraceae bacterium]|nr:sensor histidine kinase [Acutalibacteraceae bacterium]